MGYESATEQMRESLSALMDDEASDLELHRLLRESENNNELKAAWSRYQVASAALKNELPPDGLLDISGAVRARLEGEPVIHRQDASRWWAPVGRFAIAASVATAVVIGVQAFYSLPGGGVNPGDRVAESGGIAGGKPPASLPIPEGFPQPSLAARTVSSGDYFPAQTQSARPSLVLVRQEAEQYEASQALREHIKRLIMQHTENAAMNGAHGTLPYARVNRLEEE